MINNRLGRLLDTVAQTYMATNFNRFSSDDFLKTEKTFRERHVDLFRYLDVLLEGGGELSSRLPTSWRDADVKISDREFFVNESVDLLNTHHIGAR